MEWQPIETAPKDGTVVLLWGIWAGEINGPDDKPTMALGAFGSGKSDYPGDDWWVIEGSDAYAAWMRPSYWMPAPKPPATA